MRTISGLLPLPAFHMLAVLTLLFQTLSPSLFPFPGALPAPEQSYSIQQSRPLPRARLLAEVAEPSPATPASAAAPVVARQMTTQKPNKTFLDRLHPLSPQMASPPGSRRWGKPNSP